MNDDLKISSLGLNLIKQYEGLKLAAYLDSVSVPTIGYGTISYPNGTKVKLGDTCTKEQAQEYLLYKITKFEASIKVLVKVKLNQCQFDALVSFVYNLGPTNFGSSTLLKKINAKEFDDAAQEFLKWNKAGGKVLSGLAKRREAEMELFLADPAQVNLIDDSAL